MDVLNLHAPIVLVHGLLGFDQLHVGPWNVKRYFPGITEELRSAGYRVSAPRLSLTRGVAKRAAELRRHIKETFPSERVHIIGHSMGGLDARYMISQLGMENHVSALTTVGTPHRGTPFADWGIRHLSWLLTPLFRWMGISTEAFYDLTTESCQRFNEEVVDAPGVQYRSVAGQCNRPLLGLQWLFPSWIVRENEGPNDGVVSVTSAEYGESCEVWNADHLNLVNWPNRRAKARGLWQDRASDYLRLAIQAPAIAP